MPHLAPINWLIIWLFIWSSFFLFSVIIWWKFKLFYSAPFLSTSAKKKPVNFWAW
uniref:ATP synthase F0 subunit 8 n=1 Tax=Gigantopelta aegis TaxID=1735272 RepID=UPI001EDD0B2E|nr:ATP synthase F0 subunit 8 [Gigantopelta aegis]UFK31943.1 ATP synthase F0 subunit 8 [Gigantopelta aegis]UKE79911.1 ATP synthase F0 subunit 8 [Gigantopelta aegis]